MDVLACLLYMYLAQKLLQANSDDPDQTPLFAVSELGLHCLHKNPKRGSWSKKG